MAKRALCVGIDEYQDGNIVNLSGCVNDARTMARLLGHRYGFDDVKDLLNERATKENYLRAIDWLAQVSSPGDLVALYHASYGAHFPDSSGNEAAGLDEVWVVHDHNWEWTLLTDDEIASRLAKIHPSVMLVCILDTSHGAPGGAGGRTLASPEGHPKVTWARSRNLPLRGRFRNRGPDDLPNCLFFSGCAEHEVAAESPGPHGHAGIFTLSLVQALQQADGNATWDQATAQVGELIRARGAQQTPQLHAPPALRAQPLFSGSVPETRLVPHQTQGAGAAGLAGAGGGLPAAPQQAMIQTMAVTPVDAALKEFSTEDYTPRLCGAVFKVLPFAPTLTPYGTLSDAVQALNVNPQPQLMSRIQEIANSQPVSKTLWVANAIDTGDAGIAVFSGVKSAVSLFFGDKKNALETDPQQAVDAALKLLGMSYIIYRLFPGSIGERIKHFYSLPAGQALAVYYAAIEVALPFADNALAAGGKFLHTLFQRYGPEAMNKLSTMVDQEGSEGSKGVLGSLLQPMEAVVQRVAPFGQQVATTAGKYVPGAMNVADKVAGVVATGADVMPVYRYLGSRLAAEACVSIATKGN